MVPGAFEIPMVLKCILISKKYNAIHCVGAVIRGSTPHFDFVSAEVTKGVANTALKHGKSVTLGILTVDSIEQAIERR